MFSIALIILLSVIAYLLTCAGWFLYWLGDKGFTKRRLWLRVIDYALFPGAMLIAYLVGRDWK